MHIAVKRSTPAVDAGFEVETFDRVLLDGPCSALGIRPRLLVQARLRELEQAAQYQRMMMREAAHVLKVGGSMVYSTCTLNPMENEANVAWFLRRYPQMRLRAQAPVLGGPGITGSGVVRVAGGGERVEEWLLASQAPLVQRFGCGGGDEGDTVAFFIAKFEKVASVAPSDSAEPVPELLNASSS